MSPVPDRIGSYEVVRLLGKGGMAVVYLGRDPAIDRLVAIKLLRDSLDSPELRERFAREARSAGRLRHTNIVTVFQVGEHDDAPYIVMEYVPGETLGAIMKRRPRLPITWKLRVIEDVCRGLAYAHRAGIVHRDMKPANIQIDSDGVVKILDFGIARIGEQRAGEQELTRVGAIMGTPNYMAPEQINPGIADHRSDVFSVGLVLYELLTYTRAFGANSYTVLHNILHDEPAPLEQVIPDIDREVVAIVSRAMRKRPEERYQDLGEMRDDLRRVRRRLRGGAEDPIDEASVAIAAQAPESGGAPPGAASVEAARWLVEARDAYDRGDFERTVECCERVLAAEPANADAADLQNLAQTQLAVGRARGLLAAGQEAFARGQLDLAAERIRAAETLPLAGDDGATLQAQLSALRRAVATAADRANAVRDHVVRARDHLQRGELEAAAQAVDESLSLAPGNREALGLRSEIRAAAAEQERLRQQAAAEQTIAEARRLAGLEDFAAAVLLLEQHEPSHPAVTAALPEILTQQAAAERRAADLRRRQEYAAGAENLVATARDAVAERNFSEAIVHLRSIRFGADDVASDALARLQPEAEALLARSESGLYLDTAGDALHAGRFEDARAAIEMARQRDPGNPDIAGMTGAIDRAARIRELIEQARDEFHRGALEPASRSVDAALAQAPDDDEAVALRDAIRSEIEQALARRRAAEEAIAEAHQLAARGEFTRAVDLLREHQTYADVQSAMAEISEEGTRRRAARDAIATANRHASKGEFGRAQELLRPHEQYEEVQAALARIEEQRAAAEREADERRRREYASGALGSVRSARTAAERGKLPEALAQLRAIRFEGDDIASPALDAVKAEAEALVARCEAGQHLNEARTALAASELDLARAAVARARERDPGHSGLAAIEAAIAQQATWVEQLRERQEADEAEASEATLLRTVALPRRDAGERTPPAGVPPMPVPEPPEPATLPAAAAVPVAPPAATAPPAPAGPVPAPTASARPVAAVPPPARADVDRAVPASQAPRPAAAQRRSAPPSKAAGAQTFRIAWGPVVAAAVLIIVVFAIWQMMQGPETTPATTIATGPAPVDPTAVPSPAPPSPSPASGSTPAPAPAPAPGPAAAQPTPAASPTPSATPGRGANTPTPTPGPPRTQPAPTPTPQPAPRPAPENPPPAPVVVLPPPAPAPAPAPLPQPPPAPRPEVAVERPPAPAPRPADPTPDRPAPPAPDPEALRLKEEQAIRAMLAQYERAYAARDAAAVRRLHPSAPGNLDAALSAARSYQVDVRNPQIVIKGDTAIVTSTRYVRVQGAAGRAQENTSPATFSLRRGPNGWFIENVR